MAEQGGGNPFAQIAGSFERGQDRGIDVAQKAEQVKQQRAQLEEQKQLATLKKADYLSSQLKTALLLPKSARNAKLKYLTNLSGQIDAPMDPSLVNFLNDDQAVHQTLSALTHIAGLPDDQRTQSATQFLGAIGSVEDFQKGLVQFGELRARRMAAQADAMRAQAQTQSPKLSAAQEAVDKEFGKEYAAYVAAGGFTDTQKNLKQLEGVISKLQGADATGPVVGMLPKFARAFTGPKSLDLQEQVEEVMQRNLRQILGPQFTEKEGAALISRAFNPSLPTEINVKRLKRAAEQIKGMAQAKQRASQYYEQHGTLVGFKGQLPNAQSLFSQADHEGSGNGIPEAERANVAALGIDPNAPDALDQLRALKEQFAQKKTAEQLPGQAPQPAPAGVQGVQGR